MSLVSIESEILRFLASDVPEVLCLKGQWGVGKTYGWRKFLKKSKDSGGLALKRYSYVSLFGLNSIDDIRYSLFENTVTGDQIGQDPDESTFAELIRDPKTLTKWRQLAKWASTALNQQSLSELLIRSASLTVRSQLICLDDLERAGKDLGTREVLGLASQLKEERKCKVVLLLNDQEHDDHGEFSRQLEKVADTSVKFDLSPAEAAGIAIEGTGEIEKYLRQCTTALHITNIRVIKRIERLANNISEHLAKMSMALQKEAVATLVLASWAVQQPTQAPSIGFLRSFSRMALPIGIEKASPETQKFIDLLDGYPFDSVNDLDLIIIDGAEAGYFDAVALEQVALRIDAEKRAQSAESKFSKVWKELYHGSLVTEDDEFLDALVESAKIEAKFISALNINAAVRILRESGRKGDADLVVSLFMEAHSDKPGGYFNLQNHNFSSDDIIDKELVAAFEAQRKAYVDPRDPLDVVRTLGGSNGWSEDDVALLAKLSADDFERIFEALRGIEVRQSIQAVRRMGRIEGASAQAIEVASREALVRIANKSPLRRRKILSLGVPLEEPAAKQ